MGYLNTSCSDERLLGIRSADVCRVRRKSVRDNESVSVFSYERYFSVETTRPGSTSRGVRIHADRVVRSVADVATETTPLVSRRDENVRRRRLKFAATTLVTTLGAMVGIMLLRNDKTMQNDGHALVDLGDGSRIGVDEYFN